MFNDQITIKGCFKVKVFKAGKLIEDYCDPNLVVTVGKEQMTFLLAYGDANSVISQIAFGTSTINPTVADTIITDEYAKSIDDYEFPTDKSVQFNWHLDTTENNGVAMTEFGLKTFDGTLFARKVRGAIEKESDVYLEGSWTISFT